MINKDRLTNTFLDLVRLDSPSGQEKPVADHLCALLRARGYDVHVDKRGRFFRRQLRQCHCPRARHRPRRRHGVLGAHGLRGPLPGR